MLTAGVLLDELAPRRPTREHKIREDYIAAYLLDFHKSEPVKDFEDRHILYNM
jgi:hypothetical protein